MAGGLNVRQAEQRSKDKKGSQKSAHKSIVDDPNIKALEVSLANILGLKVQIVDKNGEAGEVKIFYKTLEQLDDLILRLKKF